MAVHARQNRGLAQPLDAVWFSFGSIVTRVNRCLGRRTGIRWSRLDDPYPVYRRLRDEAPAPSRRALGPLGPVAVRRRPGGRQGLGDVLDAAVGGRGNDVDDTYPAVPAGWRPGRRGPADSYPAAGCSPAGVQPVGAATRASSPIVRRKVIRADRRLRRMPAAPISPATWRGHCPRTTMFSWFGFPQEDHPQLLGWFGDMLERDAGRAAPCRLRAIAGRDRMRAYMQASSRRPAAGPARGPDVASWSRRGRPGRLSADELARCPMLLVRRGHHDHIGLISELAAPPRSAFRTSGTSSATTRRSSPRRSRAPPLRRPDPGPRADGDPRRRGARRG